MIKFVIILFLLILVLKMNWRSGIFITSGYWRSETKKARCKKREYVDVCRNTVENNTGVLMKRLVIFTCLILLCACAKNESKQNEHGTQPASSASPQPITEITPSATEQSTPPPAVKGEVPQPKVEIKEPLSLDEWVVGQSFSDVKNRIPKNSTIEFSHGYYVFHFDQTLLHFSDSGQLIFALTDIPGKSLSIGLSVGDEDSKITQIMGNPTIQSKETDYNAYIYELSSTRIDITTKNNKVNDIRLLYIGSKTIDDVESISSYYMQKTQVSNTPKPTPNVLTTPEKAPVQKNKPKVITFDEYVKISEDVLNALGQYTQIMSKDITDDEKIKKIEEIDSKYKLYDLSIMFENAVPSDEKDSKLHNRCKKFVEKVDSLFGTGMFYLKVKMKEEDEKVVTEWKKQASKELQDVWAWVNQR